MGTQLQNDCDLNYNGIDFPAATEVTGISGRPVYDSAGRTVTHTIWTLNVRTILTVDSTIPTNDIGDDMPDIKAALTRPGGRLYYRDNGFGDFEINTDVADVAWGPKPRVLNWKSHGGQFAIELNWQVEVAIVECDGANTGIPLGTPRPPMEYCYSVSYNVDAQGYSTKSVNGHIMIAQTRRSVTDRTLSDHADRLRRSIEPRCPEGFRPGARSFNLSEDKCRLDFSFSFEQLPENVPPPGVVEVKATHSLETPNMAMVSWSGTISATYQLSRGIPRRQAAVRFMELLKERIGKVRERATAGGGDVGQWAAQFLANLGIDSVVIPTRFSMSEDIYGRDSATFSLSYMVTLTKAVLPKAIEILGIFQPIPGTNWKQWYDSLRGAGRPLDVRGVAGLSFDPRDERIIDLCQGLDSGQPLGGQGINPAIPVPGDGKIDLLNAQNIFKAINAFGAEMLPANSWLEFQNGMRVEQADANVEHRLLPTAAVDQRNIQQSGTREPTGGINIGAQNAPASVIQRRGKPTVAVILEGRAARAAYAIAPPQLNSIGGVEAIPANRDGEEFFTSQVVSNSIYPICVAKWRLRWILPEVPRVPLVPPANPMYGELKSGSTRPPFTIKL